MPRRMDGFAMVPCMLAAMLAAILPILLTSQPAQEDYPGHLARAFVLYDLLTGGGRFDAFYMPRPAILPNMAFDIVVVGLQALGMGVELAGRVFLVLAALAAPLGVVAIHRQLFGRVSVLPFAAFGFAHNQVMMWGFTNYLFGVGLAFLGFAHWLRLDAARAGLARRAAVLLAWALAAYLSHLMAALFLLGLVAAHHAARGMAPFLVRTRPVPGGWRLGDAVAPLLIAGAALLALHLQASFAVSTGGGAAWTAGSVPGVLRERLMMAAHVTEAYAPLPEHFATLLLALALGLAALAGALRVCWPMVLPLAGLGALFLAAPNTLSGTGYIPDRVPIVLLFLALASVAVPAPRAAHGRDWLGRLVAGAVILLVGVRAGTATVSWVAADRAYRPILEALGRLPAGATIYSGAYYQGSVLNELRLPWAVMSAMATIRSGAFSVNVFARPGQNVLVVRPEYQALADLQPNIVGVYPPVPPPFHGDLFAPERLARFDYVLANNGRLQPGGLPPGLREIARSGNVSLFATAPPRN